MILSQIASVDMRWAMMNTVVRCDAVSSRVPNSDSDRTSSELVGSSNTMRSGSSATTRAMHRRWRCPPDNCPPRSPTGVVAERPRCDLVVKVGKAARDVPSSSRSERTGCCWRWTRRTIGVLRDEADVVVPLVETIPSAARPSTTSRSRVAERSLSNNWTSVDFPEPEGPTMPTISPGATRNYRSRSTGTPCSYANDTCSKFDIPSVPAVRPLVPWPWSIALGLLRNLSCTARFGTTPATSLHALCIAQRAQDDQHDRTERRESREAAAWATPSAPTVESRRALIDDGYGTTCVRCFQREVTRFTARGQ